MKVFNKIEACSPSYKERLIKVVSELIELREDEKATEAYYTKYLSADIRYSRWCEEKNVCELNDCLDINPQYKEFTLNLGEIPKMEAAAFRYELLRMLEDDKYSFGYIYWHLGCERNRECGYKVYDCLFNIETINYAINFDVDELTSEAEEILSLHDKYKFIKTKMALSESHSYVGELKNTYNKVCQVLIDNIKEELVLFGETTLTQDSKELNPIENSSFEKTEYNQELVKLFHGNVHLIEELHGKSDRDIARQIKQWAKKMDKLGKPLIENPDNCLKSKYAELLEKEHIITCTASCFRRYL